jgi:hypothetical protein
MGYHKTGREHTRRRALDQEAAHGPDGRLRTFG